MKCLNTASEKVVRQLEPGWESVMEKKDFKVWKRPIPNSHLYEFKGQPMAYQVSEWQINTCDFLRDNLVWFVFSSPCFDCGDIGMICVMTQHLLFLFYLQFWAPTMMSLQDSSSTYRYSFPDLLMCYFDYIGFRRS